MDKEGLFKIICLLVNQDSSFRGSGQNRLVCVTGCKLG